MVTRQPRIPVVYLAVRRLWFASFLIACPAVSEIAGAAEHPAAGSSSCLACHAPGSADAAQDAPPDLAALTPDEIEIAMAAYRSGTREGSVMPRIAKGFSAAEARAMASSLGKAEGTRQ